MQNLIKYKKSGADQVLNKKYYTTYTLVNQFIKKKKKIGGDCDNVKLFRSN